MGQVRVVRIAESRLGHTDVGCAMKVTLWTLLVVGMLTSGCSDRLREREKYRSIIGEVSVDLMVSSMHLNEVVVSKAIAGGVTDRDRQRIEDSLAALCRHRALIERVLREMYDEPELRKRDEAVRPMLREIVASTDALLSYLTSKEAADRNLYFEHRDAFMIEVEKLKELGVSADASEAEARHEDR